MTVAAGWDSSWELWEASEDDAEHDLLPPVRALLADPVASWTWRRTGPWVLVLPTAIELPSQGWKLHVSATSHTARAALEAVVPVLVRERVAFKFVAARQAVARINSSNAPREVAGKFITIYPLDDDQAVQIGQACDRATATLNGPAILSDRPLRRGSVVHYRYGAFVQDRVFDDDGVLVEVLRDPDGRLIPDERRAWFTPPAWTRDPFSASEAKARRRGRRGVTPGTGPVLLNGRYMVRHALKLANKGGVYVAEDRDSGQLVVMKEARPHVELGGGRGGYVTRLLRQEARVLAAVGHLGLSPQLLDVFEQQGHLFLVLEHFDGDTLRRQLRLAGAPQARPLHGGELQALIRSLAETMQAFHEAGVLLRDFTPNNLLVLHGGELRVVDLEFAHLLTDGPPPRWREGTLVYASPQQLSGEPSGLADDYHSLGATIAYAATGMDPCFSPDWNGRPLGCIQEWLGRLEREGVIEAPVSDMVLGCSAHNPRLRWSPRQVLDRLDEPVHRATPPAPTSPRPDQLASVVDDITRWLTKNMRENREWLWPTTRGGMRLDPCNIQTGASGVGMFLCQAGRRRDDPALRELVCRAAQWVDRQLSERPQRPPGLYFGRAGAVWFLDEAAAWLGNPALRERAGELALALPIQTFNPDITHGTAGIGLAQLRHWQVTGDSRCLDRAERAVAALCASARPGPEGVVWRVREDVESVFAGLASYGFAHGTAGIAYFLLCAAGVLTDPNCRELALEAVETLMKAVRIDDEGAAYWEVGPGRGPAESPHWCNGSSGVGTTLVRAYTATRHERYLHVAEAAARAVVARPWRGGLVQCHGLAGDGDYLLDLYAVTGDHRYRELALDLAGLIYLRRFRDGGLLVFPDESGEKVTASFGTGLSGIGAFFARLVDGGARTLMVDELLHRPLQAVAS